MIMNNKLFLVERTREELHTIHAGNVSSVLRTRTQMQNHCIYRPPPTTGYIKDSKENNELNIYNIDLRYKNTGIYSITKVDRFEELRKHQKSDVLTSNIQFFLDCNTLPYSDQNLGKLVTNLSPRTFVRDDLIWFVLPKSNKYKAVFLH
jgi:hypothetical protein